MMNWESPVTITQEIASQIARSTDDYIMSEIYKTGVVVNKEELIKAINYDRDQYNKGYCDGFNTAVEMTWTSAELLEEHIAKLNEILKKLKGENKCSE
jgi:glycerol-3-phosphate responsive antiterminator